MRNRCEKLMGVQGTEMLAEGIGAMGVGTMAGCNPVDESEGEKCDGEDAAAAAIGAAAAATCASDEKDGVNADGENRLATGELIVGVNGDDGAEEGVGELNPWLRELRSRRGVKGDAKGEATVVGVAALVCSLFICCCCMSI